MQCLYACARQYIACKGRQQTLCVTCAGDRRLLDDRCTNSKWCVLVGCFCLTCMTCGNGCVTWSSLQHSCIYNKYPAARHYSRALTALTAAPCCSIMFPNGGSLAVASRQATRPAASVSAAHQGAMGNAVEGRDQQHTCITGNLLCNHLLNITLTQDPLYDGLSQAEYLPATTCSTARICSATACSCMVGS
jgi:hypothetical protein